MLAIDWTRGFDDAWSDVATFLPKLAAGIAVFVLGWVVAKFIRRMLVKLLHKVGFQSYVDRAGLGDSLERAGYPDSVQLIGKIVYFALMLLVLQLSIGVFGDSDIANAIDGVVAFIPKLIVAVVIVVITGVVANAVGELIAPAVAHLAAGPLLRTTAVVGIWLIGGFAALDQLEVARDVVDTLFQTVVYSLGLILVIKFGVGGIWAARDRFWPAVYDQVGKEANGAPPPD